MGQEELLDAGAPTGKDSAHFNRRHMGGVEGLRQGQQHQGSLTWDWTGKSLGDSEQGGNLKSFAAAPLGREVHGGQVHQVGAAVLNLALGWPGTETKYPITHQNEGSRHTPQDKRKGDFHVVI